MGQMLLRPSVGQWLACALLGNSEWGPEGVLLLIPDAISWATLGGDVFTVQKK